MIEGKQIVLCSHFFVLGELMNAMFYKLLKIIYIPWLCIIVTFVFVRQPLRIIVSAECHAWDTCKRKYWYFRFAYCTSYAIDQNASLSLICQDVP